MEVKAVFLDKNKLIKRIINFLIKEHEGNIVITGSYFLKEKGIISRDIGDLDFLIKNINSKNILESLKRFCSENDINIFVAKNIISSQESIKLCVFLNDIKLEFYGTPRDLKIYNDEYILKDIVSKKKEYIEKSLNNCTTYLLGIQKHLFDLISIEKHRGEKNINFFSFLKK